MRIIHQQEVELINTLALSLRMSNREKIVEYFRSQYETSPNNPEIAFNYGVCMSLFTAIATEQNVKLIRQLNAINAFSRCLNQREDWWLPRFMRSELLQYIPNGFLQMSQNINSDNYKIMWSDQDRIILIEQQNTSGVDFPYFLCPYISQAATSLCRSEVDEAINWYKKGREDVTLTKSPVQLALLAHPFTNATRLFCEFGVFNCAEEIKQITSVLFPSIKSTINSFNG